MHETHGIVWSAISWTIGMFLEVVFLAFFDVGKVDFDIFITVRSAMDMEGSKGVDKLVNNSAIERKRLLSDIPSNQTTYYVEL